MTLGTFGGSSPNYIKPTGGSGSGADAGSALLDDARDAQIPSPEGMPASSGQILAEFGNFFNQLSGGSFESWSAGSSAAPDGWTLSGTGASVAKNTTNVQYETAAVDITNGASNAAYLYQSRTVSSTENVIFRGRFVTFGCRVKVSTASRVFVRIDDGVLTSDSPYHVGDGAFQTLYVTHLVDASATKLECSIRIATGSAITATADGAILVFGKSVVSYVPNFKDLALVISNVQDSGGTNYGDQGIWRAEIGESNSSNTAAVTVTFGTAFRTIRHIYGNHTGASAVIFTASSPTTTTFDLNGFDDTGARVSAGMRWLAIGQV